MGLIVIRNSTPKRGMRLISTLHGIFAYVQPCQDNNFILVQNGICFDSWRLALERVGVYHQHWTAFLQLQHLLLPALHLLQDQLCTSSYAYVSCVMGKLNSSKERTPSNPVTKSVQYPPPYIARACKYGQRKQYQMPCRSKLCSQHHNSNNLKVIFRKKKI